MIDNNAAVRMIISNKYENVTEQGARWYFFGAHKTK